MWCVGYVEGGLLNSVGSRLVLVMKLVDGCSGLVFVLGVVLLCRSEVVSILVSISVLVVMKLCVSFVVMVVVK